MAIGLIIGWIWAVQARMIEMPQIVALYNGFGGAASAIVAFLSLAASGLDGFSRTTAGVALAAGMCTLSGSLVAAGKLHRLIRQNPVIWKYHAVISAGSLLLTSFFIITISIVRLPALPIIIALGGISFFFGVVFTVWVGGADMPITISLLNALSGVSGAIAGMAVHDMLLIAIGGIVGASGLLLTQIMCRSMNRALLDILLGRTSVSIAAPAATLSETPTATLAATSTATPDAGMETAPFQTPAEQDDPAEILRTAKNIIIIPGYGMALAQAQHLVKELSDKLESRGTQVRFAIHPVAGRMPGHMNVLLSEADIPYDSLYELEAINDEFDKCDAVIIIGANDVVNPAARNAEGTPIYGMPILNADRSRHVMICNYDLRPGYAGVENPLYSRTSGITLLLGDAKDSLRKLIDSF
jgi:NAD(P) transhydrogenase subunit beta